MYSTGAKLPQRGFSDSAGGSRVAGAGGGEGGIRRGLWAAPAARPRLVRGSIDLRAGAGGGGEPRQSLIGRANFTRPFPSLSR